MTVQVDSNPSRKRASSWSSPSSNILLQGTLRQFFFFFFQFCRSVINGGWLLVGPLIQTLPTSELRPHSTAQCTLLQTILTWWNTVMTLNIKYTLTASPTSHSVSNNYSSFAWCLAYCWLWKTPIGVPSTAIDTTIELSINYYHYSPGALCRHDCTSFIVSSPPKTFNKKFHIRLTNIVLQCILLTKT